MTWFANKIGGAHVSQVPAELANLLSGHALGISFQVEGGLPVLPSPLPAAMRQIAEEVRVTLREVFGDELSAA